MENSSVSKKEWTLTEEAFAKLLAHLDPDKDRAGERYETLRLLGIPLNVISRRRS